MATPRDVPLTEFVKKLLRERTKGEQGAKLVELELRAGVSKGFFSQVLGGTSGVGPKTAAGIAAVFNYQNVMQLQNAAWEDWEAGGRAAYELVERPETHVDPEVARAITAVRAAQVSHEAIQETLRLYSSERGREWDWWIARIAEQVKLVDKKLREERVIEHKTRRKRPKKPPKR